MQSIEAAWALLRGTPEFRRKLVVRVTEQPRVAQVLGAWVLAGSLVCAACGANVTRVADSANPVCRAFVSVANHTSTPVTVFAIGRARARVGRVGAWSTLRRPIPRAVASEGAWLRFGVQPIAAALVVTDEVFVAGGQEVQWHLYDPIERSAAGIRIDHDPSRWEAPMRGGGKCVGER